MDYKQLIITTNDHINICTLGKGKNRINYWIGKNIQMIFGFLNFSVTNEKSE